MVCDADATNIKAAIANPSKGLGRFSALNDRTPWYLEMYTRSIRSSWGWANASASCTNLRKAANPYSAPYATKSARQIGLAQYISCVFIVKCEKTHYFLRAFCKRCSSLTHSSLGEISGMSSSVIYSIAPLFMRGVIHPKDCVQRTVSERVFLAGQKTNAYPYAKDIGRECGVFFVRTIFRLEIELGPNGFKSE